MTITRIDCQFYRCEALAERAGFVGLNPSQRPGSLVFAAAAAARGGISSQVASKLSVEHFVDAVLDYFSAPAKGNTKRPNASGEAEISLEILEAAFKNANSSVYNFGHRLAAGGRMAASLLGLVVEKDTVAAGRAGPGAAYLYRAGELFPFFEARDFGDDEASIERLIGAHSIVSVELASVPIQEQDILLAFSLPLDSDREQQLCVLMAEAEEMGKQSNAEQHLRRVLPRLFPAEGQLAFAMVACIGPSSIYLK